MVELLLNYTIEANSSSGAVQSGLQTQKRVPTMIVT